MKNIRATIAASLCICSILLSSLPTSAQAEGVEYDLLTTIKARSLNHVDDKACLKAIRREIGGHRGSACFGPEDKIIDAASRVLAALEQRGDAHTIAVKQPGKWTYIKIKSFGPTTADELYEVLGSGTHRRVMLDLRQNGGGVLAQVPQIALMVADPALNQPVYTETRRNTDAQNFALETVTHSAADLASEYYAGTPERVGSLRHIEFAILINKETYSGAELLAAVMRRLNPEHVFLVGSSTYGKWTGQAWFPFVGTNGAERYLVYTVARYAPGKDTMPPKHVTPDYRKTFNLRRPHEIGGAADTVYMFAMRRLLWRK